MIAHKNIWLTIIAAIIVLIPYSYERKRNGHNDLAVPAYARRNRFMVMRCDRNGLIEAIKSVSAGITMAEKSMKNM